jgi:hypothetical protein
VPVHERLYRRLGAEERPGRRAAWRPIADFALPSVKRGWVYKLMLFGSFLPLVGATFALYFLGQTGAWSAYEGLAPEIARERFAPLAGAFFGVQLFFMTFFAAVAGGPLIAEDLRRHALELYFSKPVRPVDYALGKWVALLVALVGVMSGPIVGAGAAAIGFVPGGWAAFGDLILRMAGAGALCAAVSALVVLGVSAVGRSGRYAVVLWFVVSIFTHLASVIVVAQTRDGRFSAISFRDALRVVCYDVMNVPWEGLPFAAEQPSTGLCLLVLGAWCAAAATVVASRLRKAARS